MDVVVFAVVVDDAGDLDDHVDDDNEDDGRGTCTKR